MGEYCKEYRLKYFKVGLTRFAKMNGINVKNLCAFEHDRADKIKYIVYYLKYAKEHGMLDDFIMGVFKCL